FSEPFEPPAPPPRQHTPEPHVAQPVTPPPAVAEPLTPRPATAQPQTPPPAITQPLTPPPAAAQSPRLAPSAPQDVSIPEAVEPLHPAADATPSARTTPSPAARSDAIDSGLADVLAGAGLEGVPVTPQLARSFGQIVRVVVSGVMDVLRSRQHIKDEFRMRLTQFRPADNNPLKFSANVDDALHNLLVKRNPAYLAPVAAFEDAFDDLRNHQMAMLAGMRVAFESMLAELDPDRLQHEFDRQLKNSAVLRLTARFRYWGLFRDRRVEMAKDPEATFRKLFGEEFARAYEEQLNRLKAENRAREPGANAPGQSGP
ncbi:MAG: type VI secretion system-associated FHA domain protein TagH, partial [Vicinamibacterales bacterium]